MFLLSDIALLVRARCLMYNGFKIYLQPSHPLIENIIKF